MWTASGCGWAAAAACLTPPNGRFSSDLPLTPGPSPARGEGRGNIHRFGFAYGTLADHPERGEERFVVEWHEWDDSVWYDLCAVSRPAHWLARLGYPYTRWEQARFRRLSAAAMQNAVQQNQAARS
jgi:hypothetical protein